MELSKNINKKENCGKNINRRDVLKYGLYGLAGLSSGLFVTSCAKPAKIERPNIILIVLDTTRLDHLSCYGYHRNTSPNLDKLVAESVLYTQAIAPSSWTLPSHASLFTGKFTSSHGARFDSNGPLHLVSVIKGPEAWNKYRARGLSEDELTLASILKEAGYATGAVVGGPWMKKVFGLNKGFEYYNDYDIGTLNGRLADQVTAGAVRWIEESRNKEFFLFLNYFDPHYPYNPPNDFVIPFFQKNPQIFYQLSQLEQAIASYDGEILYMDYHIGKLLENLKVNNLYDNSMIIVTADHGELFGEHGKFGHGEYLWQEEIHIPLFIKYPAGEVSPGRLDIRIQLTDILPLICKRLQMAIPEDIQGNVPPKIRHPILAETHPLEVINPDGTWRAIFEGDSKFLWNSKDKHQLFHLGNDPAEEINLIEQNRQVATRMLLDMERYLAGLPKPYPVSAEQKVDEDTKKALESLGYVK
ncbi:MAG: sulfatase [Planctomycetota bacterium]|jgi:arylsulfatase A-like enzyme